MRIKHTEPESLEASLYRQTALGEESRGALPFVVAIIIIALLAALFVGMNRQSTMIDSYGIGNPYSCKVCKNLQRACKEHRNYDAEAALTDKITSVVDGYTTGMSEDAIKMVMYGTGNLYNTACDFCNDAEKECYSCSYDRVYITSKYEDIAKSDLFITKLCDDCWQTKEVKCPECKSKLVVDIHSSIKGD